MIQTTIVFPKNEFISKFIKYFLFIKNDDPNYKKKHTCYPNTNNCLGLYKGSELEVTSEFNYSIVKSNSYHSYLTGIYRSPIYFNMSNIFDEVCIDFEPLGLEILTGHKLSPFSFLNSVIENVFSKEWLGIYDAAFESATPPERALNLEQFFLNHLSYNPKFKYIPFNKIHAHKVSHLESILNLSSRSIHRLYSNQLGLSAKEFIQIARIRKVISSSLLLNNQSQVAYEAGYSDQSHMIREFKKFTGKTPIRFFKESSSINNNVWWSITGS